MRTLIAGTIAAAALTAGLVTGTGPAGAAVPSCGNTSLRVNHSATQGATGHSNMVLWFRNITSSTCSLYGYPGLDALGPQGGVLAHAQRTLHGFTGGASAERTIVLTPNALASSDVEWHNFNFSTGGPCTFSSSIATTPPNTSHTVHYPVSVSVCGLEIHPTVAGSTGNS